MNYNIAIDGPSGAGKSTVAKKVAKNLQIIYVDTGAMYRTMALYLIRQKIDCSETEKINSACKLADISIQYINGEQQVFLNGENVSVLLRSEEVGSMTSSISVNEEVRRKMVELQKEMADSESVVMDGRDIGTCVLPDAFLKIYLTAGVEIRAKRRYEELIAKGENADLYLIQKKMEERDYRDMTRKISPLIQAEDSILLDTSEMDVEEAIAFILQLYNKKKKEGGRL